jgi:FtsP/CotA-like multicopper oxidase with cupredoxin domain
MQKLSRREFLKRFSLGAAGAYVTLNASPSLAKVSAGKAKSEAATGIIDPPIGAPFKDPPEMQNLSTTPGIVEVNVEAKPAMVNINGTMARLLTYNGSCPAPTIRVKSGDRLNIHFRNSLPAMDTNVLEYDQEVTNLHTHGLHVSPVGNADNVMLMFVSGNSFDYQYDLVAQEPGTLNCYHPFSQGTSAEQYWGGLAGALVVEDENTALAGYETHILVLKDITLSGGAPEPYSSRGEYLTGREGNTVMVNGQVNPELLIRPGQVQRWRVMNASNARFYKLELENHSLQIIGTDAGLLDKPYSVPSMLLAPGERLDLLVKGDQAPKSYRLLSLPYDRGAGNSGQQVTLMTLSYKGSVAQDALPAALNHLARRSQAKPVRTERIVLSLGQKGGFINNRSFSDREVYTAESDLGTYEAWEIMNLSGIDIPFSLQVNPFQVLSVSGGDPAYASFYTRTPAWKDTVIVPRRGSVKVVVPVMDFTGLAVFYSQILEHADLGMMGIWDISRKEINTEDEV